MPVYKPLQLEKTPRTVAVQYLECNFFSEDMKAIFTITKTGKEKRWKRDVDDIE